MGRFPPGDMRSARADSPWSLFRMALWALRCMILGDGPISLIKHQNARAWLTPSRRTRLMALAKPIADNAYGVEIPVPPAGSLSQQ